MDISESVDFDFFDTPRCDNLKSPQSKKVTDKNTPGPTSAYRQKKHGDADRSHNGDTDKKIKDNSKKEDESMSSESEISSSDSESMTPRGRKNNKNKRHTEKNNRDRSRSSSESSSAYSYSDYSNSDYSSDDNAKEKKIQVSDKKETLNVRMPRAHVAWNDEPSETAGQQGKQLDESSDSEIDLEHESVNNSNNRKPKLSQDKRKRYNGKKKLVRSSSSFSNNSDITDVSPLESPEGSPRYSKEHRHEIKGKETGVYKGVQYSDKNVNHSINLESDEIDLSILMKCMEDIDKEKQQRLKTNSRRVMFEQPSTGGGRQTKGNYTFSMGQAKLIEKENQRLLKKIMNQMTGSVKKAPDTIPRQRGPKRVSAPGVQRLTPSAVNRMREQRRIEDQNMQMLNRLQSVRPSKGMSRCEQINEAERQMSYGIPGGTVIVKGEDSLYDTRSYRSLHSSMSQTAGSTQRSRPSSAKSNSSFVVSQGKRSRPSSAKSNASVRSNASMRSNVSKMSGFSMRSNLSTSGARRMADGRADKRPLWDDRFSFS